MTFTAGTTNYKEDNSKIFRKFALANFGLCKILGCLIHNKELSSRFRTRDSYFDSPSAQAAVKMKISKPVQESVKFYKIFTKINEIRLGTGQVNL